MARTSTFVVLLLVCICKDLISTTYGLPTTTMMPPTTMAMPTTTTECQTGASKVENCFSFYCHEGYWQQFEFTATMSCCTQQLENQGYMHPRCEMMFPELIPTTPGPPTTTTLTTTTECQTGASKEENCFSFYCHEGYWQQFEFTATMSCCTQQLENQGYMHPRCEMMFPELIPTTPGPPTTTTLTTTTECQTGASKEENCFSFYCHEGYWQQFEFTATMSCCTQQLENQGDIHPRCKMIFPELFSTSAEPSTTTSTTTPTTTTTTTTMITTTAECQKGDSRVENCTAFSCNEGRWQRVKFTATKSCCRQQRKEKGKVNRRCRRLFRLIRRQRRRQRA